MTVIEEGTPTIQFDIWDLTIESVKINYYNADWVIAEGNPAIGQVLVVDIPFTVHAGDEINVAVKYSTVKTGQAFSWLTPDQTAGKVYPYMFT